MYWDAHISRTEQHNTIRLDWVWMKGVSNQSLSSTKTALGFETVIRDINSCSCSEPYMSTTCSTVSHATRRTAQEALHQHLLCISGSQTCLTTIALCSRWAVWWRAIRRSVGGKVEAVVPIGNAVEMFDATTSARTRVFNASIDAADILRFKNRTVFTFNPKGCVAGLGEDRDWRQGQSA